MPDPQVCTLAEEWTAPWLACSADPGGDQECEGGREGTGGWGEDAGEDEQEGWR